MKTQTPLGTSDANLEAPRALNTSVFVICFISFLVPFMGSAITLALPRIGTHFSMNAVTLSLMATVYLASTAMFQIPFSKLADKYGRKKWYFFGMLFFSLTTIGCGFAPTVEVLLLLRFAEGMGSAVMFGTGMAILVTLYPAEKRGHILGINTAVVYVALAAGPLIGGLLTDHWGWQSLFIITGGTCLIALIVATFAMKTEWKESQVAPFDWLGAAIYALAILSIIYGFTSLKTTPGIICLAGGIALAVAFVIYENRVPQPVLNVKLLSRKKVLAMSTLAALINYASTAGLSFLLSLYLQYILGLQAKEAGLVLIPQALVQSFVALLSGRLSDKISPARLATIGMSIIVLGIAGMIFINENTSLFYIISLLVLLGIGYGMFSSPNTNVIMSSVAPKYYGQASAITGTARLIGQTFSLGIAGMVISFFLGESKIIPEVYPQFLQSIRTTFIIFLVLCICGVWASTGRLQKAKTPSL